MGNLFNGKWTPEDTLSEIREGGRYIKNPSVFRNAVTADGSSGFKAEPDRYHLYVSTSCPWAHRTMLFRVLKKLEGIVAMTDTSQTRGGQGWTFCEGGHRVPGTGKQVQYLHEIYSLADPQCTSRVTVPTLWDSTTRTVVNNESAEILRMFNSAFAAFAPAAPDYYPAHLRAAIDAMNEKVLRGVNNGVNGCGRSASQEAYDESFELLFNTLDEIEDLLGRQRYLCGERQTEADWRLYPNLLRFDSIFYIGYKCNLRRIEDYPNLSNYLRDLYQTPGIAAVSDVDAMKQAIFGGNGPVKGNGIVPKGPWLGLDRRHNRERFREAA
ncbi:MAG: glutathione S-transferase family protein [Betaproteobacteria bacterium]|nr:glutathione S-transferase family protein [Betaproteobacteria bacterium]